MYQSDAELVERVKELLVRELSTIGSIVPEYDDQQELPARLAAIGDPPAYEPPDEYTLFGDTVPGNMWEQQEYIIQAFYEMTDAQVAQLPNGIREQVMYMKAEWGQQ